MASCITSQWAGSYTPQIKLEVTQSSSTATTATLSWKLYYIAKSAANVSSSRAYVVKINGSTVKDSTYSISGKTGTYTIASGTKTINKTHSSQSISFSCSMDFDLTWSGTYGGTKSASGSISVAAKTKYTISYNANGGSGAPGSQTKWHGENLTISSTKPTRTGYTFQGWSLTKSGSVYYSSGGTCGKNENLTLYAVWKINTYTISYNPNGGSGVPSNQTKTYGKALTLSSTKPTRTGYTFLGWSTSSSATSATWKAGGSYTTNASDVLYAVWKINTYTISYNPNGGSGVPSNQTKTYGKALTLSSTKPTRTGYIFLGWSTSASATTAKYVAGANYTTNAGATLYAVWKVAYVKPRITKVSIARCDSDGTTNDEGQNGLVSFSWNCDNNVSSITIKWKLVSETAWTGSTTVSASGTSGTIKQVIGNDNLNIDNTYDIRIIVSDSGGSSYANGSLASTKFIIDILAGGKGIAFGKAAELSDYMDVSFATKHRKSIEFDNNQTIKGIKPDGTIVEALKPQNASGNTIIGYGNYMAKSGLTNIYGYDVNIGISNVADGADFYKPYYNRGDTITINIRTAGYVTNSGKDLYFWVPTSKPIIGSPTATATSNAGFTLRQGGKYTHGSSATNCVTPSSYEISATYATGICVKACFSDTTNVTNNDAIGIYWGGTITFS